MDSELFEIEPGGFNPYWLAADHIRTATLLLGDGVTPGNVGRNYVLRRLIRRIIAQAYRFGVREPFIMKLSDLVIDKLGDHYVDLKQKRDELRLKIHLASKEAQEEWEELEEKMQEFSSRAELGRTSEGLGDALGKLGQERCPGGRHHLHAGLAGDDGSTLFRQGLRGLKTQAAVCRD